MGWEALLLSALVANTALVSERSIDPYTNAVDLLIRRIRWTAPERNLAYLACPHGPLGFPGAPGHFGDWDLSSNDSVDLYPYMIEANTKGPFCDIDDAVTRVLKSVYERYRHLINNTLPSGPLGPFGLQGMNATTELKYQISRVCWKSSTPLGCPFTDVLINATLTTIETFTGLCPPNLPGPMGFQGPRGVGAMTRRLDGQRDFTHTREPKWAKQLEVLCPRLLSE